MYCSALIILGIDFLNNVEWYQRQLKFGENFVETLQPISKAIFGNFKIGYEILIYNGFLLFLAC